MSRNCAPGPHSSCLAARAWLFRPRLAGRRRGWLMLHATVLLWRTSTVATPDAGCLGLDGLLWVRVRVRLCGCRRLFEHTAVRSAQRRQHQLMYCTYSTVGTYSS